MKADKRVLVTGATGFIGSNLIGGLLDSGYRVVAIDKDPMKGSRIEKYAQGVEFFQINLLEEEKLLEFVKRISPSHVVHLAARIDVRRDSGIVRQIMQDNFGATLNLYNSLLKVNGLKRVVAISSADVYGQNEPPFTEDMTPKPVSAYGLSKAAISFLCSMYYRLYALPVVELRPFLVYGPGQTNAQFVPAFIRNCLLGKEKIPLTPGNQTRDFVYVGDLVEAILLGLKAQQGVLGEAFNICSGEEVSIKEAAQLIAQLTGFPGKVEFGAEPYRPNESMHFFGLNAKAQRLLGWAPSTGLAEGLKQAIAWQKQH
jgi:nucleoside-diphosphate-sugar epimerase